MSIDDDDLLTAITSHLVGGFLEQVELQVTAISYRSGLVPGLENLTKIVFGKHDGVFLLGGVQRRIAHIEQICSERKVGSMLF